jgi:SAM-dependent methyltransferase
MRALILGVTQELFHLLDGARTDLLAIDHTQGMIDQVWPGPRSRVVRADWTALPIAPRCRDLALCDGGLQQLSYPHGQSAVVRSLHRVLAPGGLCIVRLFVPPSRRESVEQVFDDLLENRVSSLNLLKLRLWMAMQQDAQTGVRLADIWTAVHDIAPDFPAFSRKLGWNLEHLLAIDAYRDCPKRYYLIDLEQAVALFCDAPGGFAVESVREPTYPCGEQCPTLILRCL